MNRGLIFDLDETLIDRRQTLDAYARALLSEFRLHPSVASPDAFVAQFHRYDDNGDVPRDEFFDRLASDLFVGVTRQQLGAHFDAYAWREPHLFPGTTAMLAYFRQREWRIGIVTNGGASSQSAKIANSGLSNLVHCSVISSVVGRRKPDREIFAYATRELGVLPNLSWFVGDDPRVDIWGANRFGLRTVWIERYKRWPEDLPRCYDTCVPSVAGIAGTVDAPE
jgi:putative hydrolase of the HAD superfamily